MANAIRIDEYVPSVVLIYTYRAKLASAEVQPDERNPPGTRARNRSASNRSALANTWTPPAEKPIVPGEGLICDLLTQSLNGMLRHVIPRQKIVA
jgi:hypothetical protein